MLLAAQHSPDSENHVGSYYRARYYDPSVGRFLSEDPLEFGGKSATFYEYAYNDAPDFVDPSGTQSGDPCVRNPELCGQQVLPLYDPPTWTIPPPRPHQLHPVRRLVGIYQVLTEALAPTILLLLSRPHRRLIQRLGRVSMIPTKNAAPSNLQGG